MSDETSSPPRQDWIVTFADMMSLLLAFFILLVSLNGLKQDRREDQFQSMLSSLRNRFGQTATANPAPGAAQPRPRKSDEPSAGRAQRHQTMQGTAHVRAWSKRENSAATAREDSPAGARPVGARLNFAPGSEALDFDTEQEMQRFVADWQRQAGQILVRGFSTGRSLAEPSPFRDEWDLAYERCHVVVERLAALGVQPQYLRVAVSAPGTSWDRAAPLSGTPNDQINVVLLGEFTDELVTQAQDAPLRTPANE